jgi:murein DD-endopeptidase MepM/ murein hydrolase activator NlpD
LPQIIARLSRRRAVRWSILAVALLPFAGGLTAFGTAPATVTEEVVVSPVVEQLALDPVLVSGSAEDNYWQEERVQRGDTFARVLARLRIDDADAVHFLRTSPETRGLRQLVPGQILRANTDEDGRLLELRFASSGLMVLTVKPYGGSFRVREEVATLERRIVMRSAQIKTTLFAAIDAAELDDTIAKQVAEIFSTDIDFHSDLRPGDRFTVIYERYFADGEPVQWGRVLATEFVNAGHPHQAIWYQHPDGRGDYYTPDGKALRKAFLRSPLEYSRVSSAFAEVRFHPILQLWRAHRGIDYAAAPGTGVKASSDGVVESATHDRGYGNVVVLRHEQRLTTLYAHLSSFGRGISRGARVSQGQVIGYVGSTGLATGPHLHYEFRVGEVHQDPLKVAMPEAPPITAELKAKFDIAARPMIERLSLLRNANVARLN